jgi:hypothetical protein
VKPLARLSIALFALVTAVYAFLASSSFTYQQFLRPRVLEPVAWFSDWHVLLYWLWLPAAVASLVPELRQRGPARPMAIGFVAVWSALGLGLAVHPVLPGLIDDHRSILVGLAALLPLIWLAAIDHLAVWESLRRRGGRVSHAEASGTERRLLVAASGAATFAAVTYGALTPLALRGAFEPDLLTPGLTLGLMWSVYQHLLVFCGVFLLFALVNRLVASSGFWLQYAAEALLLAGLFGIALQWLLGTAIGLDDRWGQIATAGLSVAVVSTWGAVRLRRWDRERARLVSGFDVFFGPAEGTQVSVGTVGSLIGIVALAQAFAVAAARLDWDFLLLKLGVLCVWIGSFAQIYRASSAHSRLGVRTVLTACVVPFAVYLIDPWAQSRLTPWFGGPGSSVHHTLDRYLVYNPTFRLAHDALHVRSADTPAFDHFLRAHTGLNAASVSPASIDFVPDLKRSLVEQKPYLFLFVLDSLRADYLSPYNTQVRFTPNVKRFADDSLVFHNAFTRYGGTGLSMSAIWMGAAGPHRQYVQPFRPMNALEKLLDANDYRRYVSMDHIMQQLLAPSPLLRPLDSGIPELDYDFCRTLEEIGQNLDSAGPFFAHTRSLNLHVAALNSGTIDPDEAYPGFERRYAARVRRIDGCFGAFLDVLKRTGVFDRSVIVLTGDHGEMLGEDRQWGHAYYLFPPVLEIPLIVHLPAAIARRTNTDPDAVSFSTDITPTLYAALGYEPRQLPLMGLSLLGRPGADFSQRRRATEVVAASYGAVWGALERNGRQLYIVDANHSKEYAYERVPRGSWHAAAITADLRASSQRAIREHIYLVSHLYQVRAD